MRNTLGGRTAVFPLTIDGQFEHGRVREDDLPALVRGIAGVMLEVGANDVSTSSDSVQFRAGPFRGGVSPWNVLSAVDRGTVSVEPGEPGRIRYSFSRTRLLGVGLGIVVVMAAWIGFETRDLAGPIAFIVWMLVGFGLIAGTVDAIRLRALVRRAAGPEVHDGVHACPECGALFDPADYESGATRLCERCHAVLPS